MLTVVMYHYVRPIKASPYPDIKGLELDLFDEQLEYLSRFYEFVTLEQCIAALRGKDALPKNAILLTFDDGYIDHYAYVFPRLAARKISGAFFIPSQVIAEHKLLDVNKIHFVLASGAKSSTLLDELFKYLDAFRGSYELLPRSEYEANFASLHRFDTPEVAFMKRLLQRELPEPVREALIDSLFQKYVSADEPDFARQLYISVEQIQEMYAAGMAFGPHGHRHRRFNTLSTEAQQEEVRRPVEFLRNIGIRNPEQSMCYPFGEYNEKLLEFLRSSGCKIGFTIEANLADLANANPLLVPRFDTNDLPKSADAGPNEWTRKIL